MRLSRVALPFLAVAMATGLQVGATARNHAAAQGRIDAQRLARIPARMQEFVDEGKLAGAVLLLVDHDGVLLLEAVGYKNVATREPMATDAIFRMASVAKPLTAMGIMALQEDGRLSIYDFVARHLPEFAGDAANPHPGRISLRQLLTHTSGMTNEQAAMPAGFWGMSLAEVVAHYARTPVTAAPGGQFIYSSPGFDTLARIIEVTSGQPFTAFMDERFFGPLGMTETSFLVPAAKRGRLPSFYRIEDGLLQEGVGSGAAGPNPSSEEATFPAPAWGLHSTAPDLAALLRMLLNEGAHEGDRILSAASLNLMTTDQIRRDGLPRWGLGWTVGALRSSFAAPLTSDRSYGHMGSTGVAVWVDPPNDLAGAFLVHQAGRETREAATSFVNMATAAVTSR